MTTINKLILKGGRNPGTYNIGGSGGSQPAPNSVGTEEIKDGGVQAEDLDPNMFISPEEARNKVADAIEKAEREHGIQDGES